MENDPLAAQAFDEVIAEKAEILRDFPRIGRIGRVAGTFELVIHNNYMLIYELFANEIYILNLVHTSRKWPLD